MKTSKKMQKIFWIVNSAVLICFSLFVICLYLQCEDRNPLNYSYIEKDGISIQQVTDDPRDPEDFPKPCNY